MKRGLLTAGLVGLLVLVWVMLPRTASADGAPVFSLSLSNHAPASGDKIQITVLGQGLSDLYSYEVTLEFDSDRLAYDSWSSPATGYSVAPMVTGKQLRFAHTKIGSVPGDNGQLNLGTVTFTTKGNGNVVISLKSVKLIDSQLVPAVQWPDTKVSVTISSRGGNNGGNNGGDNGGNNGGNSGGDNSGNNGGNNGGNSGGSGPKAPDNPQQTNHVLKLESKLDTATKTATAVVDAGSWKQAVQQAKTDKTGNKKIRLETAAVPEALSYVQKLPTTALTETAEPVQIEIATKLATVTMPSNLFRDGELQPGEIGLRIGKADVSHLDEQIRNQIGNHPVIDLSFESGNKTVSWSNPNAPVSVSFDYTPSAAEGNNPEHITIWYIDGQGNASAVPNGRYDPQNGKVTFHTTHFSIYAAAFVKKTFDDLDPVEWAKKPIEVLAAKGIVQGMTDKYFNPDQMVTRADFVVLLVRTLELKGPSGDAFSDVDEGDYFNEPIRIARGLGITEGIGDNRFDPTCPITREDMMVLAERALTAARNDVGDAGDAGGALSGFGDVSEIANYAQQSVGDLVKAGLIDGYGDGIHPKDFASRAQTAVFMYNLYHYSNR